MRHLVEAGALELTPGSTVEALAGGVAAFLDSEPDPTVYAQRLSSWLFEQPEVAELYASDEQLGALLASW